MTIGATQHTPPTPPPAPPHPTPSFAAGYARPHTHDDVAGAQPNAADGPQPLPSASPGGGPSHADCQHSGGAASERGTSPPSKHGHPNTKYGGSSTTKYGGSATQHGSTTKCCHFPQCDGPSELASSCNARPSILLRSVPEPCGSSLPNGSSVSHGCHGPNGGHTHVSKWWVLLTDRERLGL